MNLLGSPPQLLHLPSSLHTANTELPDLLRNHSDSDRAKNVA